MKRDHSPKRKRRLFRKAKPGTAPGTLAVDPKAPKPKIRVIAYGPEEMTEKEDISLHDIPAFLEKWPVTWINVDGLGDADILRGLGEMLNLHKLALEDVVNVHQRAKVEKYGETLFIVARMLRPGDRLDTEQFSLFLGTNYVLSFQEVEGDCFDPVRERIRAGRPILRKAGPDYMAYALLDAIMDLYFPMLEKYDERIDQLEQEVLDKPNPHVIEGIHSLRKDLMVLRRAVWPKREAVNSLLRTEDPLVAEATKLYIRDCYDHAVQIIDMLENLREVASGLVDLYHSAIGHRMNEIMKVLTLIATIFIPLSFVAGLYGMNFDPEKSPWNMPELGWYFGYPALLLLMVVIAAGQLLYFRKRGWIGRRAERDSNKE